ncbi:MAG: hypothetical protein WBP46_16040 [Thiolinea sp.]
MSTQRRSAATVAQLLIINVGLYSAEKDKEISRYKFSSNTLRSLANRQQIRESFTNGLFDELYELGWYLVFLEGEYGIFSIKKLESWIKLSGIRLKSKNILKKSDDEINELFYAQYYTDLLDDDALED